MATLAACAAAYLLGGIPFALILVRLLRGVDIRTIGSGNVGATNASRAFGGRLRLPMFGLIYLLDFAKGLLPALAGVAWLGGLGYGVLLGACAVLGHCASPYLGFRGGKGVATTTGVVAAVALPALLIALGVFFVVLAVTRQVFLGSLALGVALALAIPLLDAERAFGERAAVTAFGVAIAVFLFYTHRSNLKKMLAHRAARTNET